MTIELSTLGNVIKAAYEGQSNTNAYTDIEKEKLGGIDNEATKNSSDTYLIDRSNHTGFQDAATITGLTGLLDEKVDKITGYGLSETSFTQDEKTKLSGLEGPHFKGTYMSLTALNAAGIPAVAGDYADVDGGEGQETFRCIWDVSNNEWVQQLGTSTQLTGAQIKSEYEAQPDTNAYTNAEKEKLSGIAAEATKNSADETLLNRSNHTGLQSIATVNGLQDALDGKVGVDGLKVLSDNNYTTAEKDKLDAITALTGSTNFTWRFKGAWNPNTNNPNLQNGTGTPGDFFSVSANGTRSFGSQTFNFIEGDLVLYSGGVWRRISVNPVNYKPRGTISPPIPALYCTRSTTNNSYARITEARIRNWTAQYNPYSILNDGVISIPSWASHARVSCNVVFTGAEVPVSPATSNRYGAYVYRNSGNITASTNITNNMTNPTANVQTGIFPVSLGDTLHVTLWHDFAANKELHYWSWLQVELFEAQ